MSVMFCGLSSTAQNDDYNPPVLVMPNVFSPNGDGVNDTFDAVFIQDVFNPQLWIFDRWGEQLFYTVDLTKGWDGTFEGEQRPNGSYHYFVLYEDQEFEEQKQAGVFHLNR